MSQFADLALTSRPCHAPRFHTQALIVALLIVLVAISSRAQEPGTLSIHSELLPSVPKAEPQSSQILALDAPSYLLSNATSDSTSIKTDDTNPIDGEPQDAPVVSMVPHPTTALIGSQARSTSFIRAVCLFIPSMRAQIPFATRLSTRHR